jgi:hypothetical protein
MIMEKLAQVYALNEWLTDYPDDMEYEDVMKVLNKDHDACVDDEWRELDIVQWYLLDGHTGAQIAQFIEDTYESALRLLKRAEEVL